MRRDFRKTLFRSFEPGWPERRRRRLERALARSPELRAEREKTGALRRAVADSGVPGFRPGFADRVLARLASCPAAAIDVAGLAFRAIFDRFALVAGIVTIILVLFNLLGGALIPSHEIPYASSLTITRLLKTPLW